MAGNLFVIEGLDGSGKATQTMLLCDALAHKGLPYRQITFPDYDSESSALVKMYLQGGFGGDPGSVNPYAASSFYAVDRFASFQRSWKQDYEAGSVILADRYVTSNLIYQLSKVTDEEKDTFIDWVQEYEYGKLGLPRPQATIYLDMKPEVSQSLLRNRYQGDESKRDIHERNLVFLNQCRESALYSAEKLGWHIVPCCTEDQVPKSISAVHTEILSILERYLEESK